MLKQKTSVEDRKIQTQILKEVQGDIKAGDIKGFVLIAVYGGGGFRAFTFTGRLPDVAMLGYLDVLKQQFLQRAMAREEVG